MYIRTLYIRVDLRSYFAGTETFKIPYYTTVYSDTLHVKVSALQQTNKHTPNYSYLLLNSVSRNGSMRHYL
jgi:hypothetical protein